MTCIKCIALGSTVHSSSTSLSCVSFQTQDGKVSALSEEVMYVDKGLLHVSNLAPVKGSDRYIFVL